MDPLIGYVVAGVVSLLVGLGLRELEPKVKLVYWASHNFLFQIPTTPGTPTATSQSQQQTSTQTALLTHSITVQNQGRRNTENVEIAHQRRPDFFQLQPALSYREITNPSGEHIVRVESLGPQEWFTIEFLSYATIPTLLYIRSPAGQAELIQVQGQKIYPKWVIMTAILLIGTGLGFIAFWLIRGLISLYQILRTI